MAEVSPLQFEDYKAYLKVKVASNKMEKAYQSKLADAAGCQKSYLSQVLNSQVNLTADHAAGMSQFLGLSEEEAVYFVDLVTLARTGSSPLKSMLLKRMKTIKTSRGNPSQRFKWPEVKEQLQDLYYSSWHWGAIHILVSIPRFQSAKAISDFLRIPLSTVERTLSGLEEMKLIERTKIGWKVSETFTYLPKSSHMTSSNHLNWRQRAIANVQSMDESALHYSSAFALGRDDFDKLKEMIVQFIEGLNNKISSSPSEEACAFTCDLFRL